MGFFSSGHQRNVNIEYSKTVSVNYQSKKFGLTCALPDSVNLSNGLAMLEFCINAKLFGKWERADERKHAVDYEACFGEDIGKFLDLIDASSKKVS